MHASGRVSCMRKLEGYRHQKENMNICLKVGLYELNNVVISKFF